MNQECWIKLVPFLNLFFLSGFTMLEGWDVHNLHTVICCVKSNGPLFFLLFYGLWRRWVFCVWELQSGKEQDVSEVFHKLPFYCLLLVFQLQWNQRYGCVAAESFAIPESIVFARYGFVFAGYCCFARYCFVFAGYCWFWILFTIVAVFLVCCSMASQAFKFCFVRPWSGCCRNKNCEKEKNKIEERNCSRKKTGRRMFGLVIYVMLWTLFNRQWNHQGGRSGRTAWSSGTGPWPQQDKDHLRLCLCQPMESAGASHGGESSSWSCTTWLPGESAAPVPWIQPHTGQFAVKSSFTVIRSVCC